MKGLLVQPICDYTKSISGDTAVADTDEKKYAESETEVEEIDVKDYSGIRGFFRLLDEDIDLSDYDDEYEM